MKVWISLCRVKYFDSCCALTKSLEMTAENAAQAFYVRELEQELRQLNRTDYLFKSDGDPEQCFKMIESIRRENIYPHPSSECSPACQARGILGDIV